MLKHLFSFLILGLLFWGNANAQEAIYLKNGEELKTAFSIEYSPGLENDKIIYTNAEGEKQTIAGDRIEYVITKSGIPFFAFEVDYYSNLTSKIQSRVVFLSKIIEGTVALYKYEGKDYSYVIEREGQRKVLQELDMDNPVFSNYKTVLLEVISDKVERVKIFTAKYTVKNFAALINEYNKKIDTGYIPISSRISYLKEYQYGINVGTYSTDLSFSYPVNIEIPSGFLTVGQIDFENQRSNNISISGYFQQKFKNKKSLYFLGTLTILRSTFSTRGDNSTFPERNGSTTLFTSSNLSNLTINEALFSGGLAHKLGVNKSVYINLSVQPTVWVRITDVPIYHELRNITDLVYDRKNARNVGFGIFNSLGLEYKASDFISILLNTFYFLRNGKNLYTGGTVPRLGQASSESKESLNFSIGIRINRFR